MVTGVLTPFTGALIHPWGRDVRAVAAYHIEHGRAKGKQLARTS